MKIARVIPGPLQRAGTMVVNTFQVTGPQSFARRQPVTP